jgi:pyridoxine 4-dehydrogenase
LGALTGKYSQNGPFPKGIRGILFRQMLPKIGPVLQTLGEIAQGRNKTPAQVALNWCICKGTIPIPGAKNLEQAKQNIGAMGWQLDAGEMAELDKVSARVDKPMVQNIFQTQ